MGEPTMPIASDRALSFAAGRGDLKAFEELYKRHNRRVYSICLRMTRNAHEAEDLTQDTFVDLFRKLSSFRGEAAFTTWLYRVAVNKVLMHFRKVSASTEYTTEDGEKAFQVVRGTENPARMSLIDRISLAHAMRKLAPGYYKVFVLHDIEGYEHHEIAEMLGFSIHTSKSQLHKARLKLREFLTEQTISAA